MYKLINIQINVMSHLSIIYIVRFLPLNLKPSIRMETRLESIFIHYQLLFIAQKSHISVRGI